MFTTYNYFRVWGTGMVAKRRALTRLLCVCGGKIFMFSTFVWNINWKFLFKTDFYVKSSFSYFLFNFNSSFSFHSVHKVLWNYIEIGYFWMKQGTIKYLNLFYEEWTVLLATLSLGSYGSFKDVKTCRLETKIDLCEPLENYC